VLFLHISGIPFCDDIANRLKFPPYIFDLVFVWFSVTSCWALFFYLVVYMFSIPFSFFLVLYDFYLWQGLVLSFFMIVCLFKSFSFDSGLSQCIFLYLSIFVFLWSHDIVGFSSFYSAVFLFSYILLVFFFILLVSGGNVGFF